MPSDKREITVEEQSERVRSARLEVITKLVAAALERPENIDEMTQYYEARKKGPKGWEANVDYAIIHRLTWHISDLIEAELSKKQKSKELEPILDLACLDVIWDLVREALEKKLADKFKKTKEKIKKALAQQK